MAGEGYAAALCKVNRVFHNLKDCSAELKEVERIVTELNSDAPRSSDDIKERSDLFLVAGAVRDVLNVLKTGIEGISAEQEVSTRSKRAKISTQGEPSNVCGFPGPETRVATAEICNHTCMHHPVIVNPRLWSKLGEDLIRLVFARLPIPRIVELRNCSEAWSAMSKSSSFAGAFAETNPNLFGLLGWDCDFKNFRTRILDVTFKEWHSVELEFPKGHGCMDYWHACEEGLDPWYGCDGGLVCFVPVRDEDEYEYVPDSLFVCNPLTNTWKIIPDVPLGFKDPVMVQLVMDRDSGCYRVILIYLEKVKNQDVQPFGVSMYDSKTESWSVMNSGVVYGTDRTLLDDRGDPLLFDCATKRMVDLDRCPSIQDLKSCRFAFLEDRLFVLHTLINPDPAVDLTERFAVSEYTWTSSTAELRKLNDYEVTLNAVDFGLYAGRKNVEIFASTGFILLTWYNLAEDGIVRQLSRIYDLSAGQWCDVPPFVEELGNLVENIEGVLMCELRWDAIP